MTDAVAPDAAAPPSPPSRSWRALLRRLRRPIRHVAWMLGASAVAAAGILGWLHGAVIVGLGLASLLAGLGLADAAVTRDLVRRTLRRVPSPEDAGRADRRRVAAALALVVPAFALAALFVPVASWRPQFASDAIAAPGVSHPASIRGVSDAGPAEPGAPGPAAPGGDAGERLTSDAAEPPSRDPWLLRRVLLEITPSRGGLPTGPLGALYVRGLVFTDLGPDGLWTDDRDVPQPVRDADDGCRDGWCELATRPAPPEALDLEVRQRVVAHPVAGHAVVHSTPGLAAVRLPAVRRVPEGSVLAPGVTGDTLACGLAVTLPSRLPFPSERTRAMDRDPRATLLPRGDPAFEALARLAAELTAGVPSDVGRVRAVVRHLRERYSYTVTGDEVSGVGALQSFLDDRGGTCVQFAEAAAAMLRSLGLSARVVHGFLVRDWDSDRGCHVARGRDYHAWIEVDFEGCGWVTFDATPRAPDDLDSGLGRPAPPGERGSAVTEVERAVAAVDEGVGTAVGAVADAILGHPWLAAAAAALAAAAAWTVFRRRRARLEGRQATGHADRSPWGRLVAELGRRGHVRHPAQTAGEFAAAVVARGGDRMLPFVLLTRRQQAARFGGSPLGPEDETDIEHFRASLA